MNWKFQPNWLRCREHANLQTRQTADVPIRCFVRSMERLHRSCSDDICLQNRQKSLSTIISPNPPSSSATCSPDADVWSCLFQHGRQISDTLGHPYSNCWTFWRHRVVSGCLFPSLNSFILPSASGHFIHCESFIRLKGLVTSIEHFCQQTDLLHRFHFEYKSHFSSKSHVRWFSRPAQQLLMSPDDSYCCHSSKRTMKTDDILERLRVALSES